MNKKLLAAISSTLALRWHCPPAAARHRPLPAPLLPPRLPLPLLPLLPAAGPPSPLLLRCPHARRNLNNAVQPLLAKQGIDLVVKEFDDYVIPNTALEAGELDANYFQHVPYLNDFNEKNGTHIAVGTKVHFETMAIYPGKTATLENLADGATFAIPNDTTNEARALQLLAAQGLITLKDGVGLEATPNDIVENPKNLKFEEIEAAQVPNVLADVDFGIANGNYALSAGIADTALVKESAESEAATTYANVLAIREGDDRPELKALEEALNSQEVKDYINETYHGTVIAVF